MRWIWLKPQTTWWPDLQSCSIPKAEHVKEKVIDFLSVLSLAFLDFQTKRMFEWPYWSQVNASMKSVVYPWWYNFLSTCLAFCLPSATTHQAESAWLNAWSSLYLVSTQSNMQSLCKLLPQGFGRQMSWHLSDSHPQIWSTSGYNLRKKKLWGSSSMSVWI